MTHTDPARGLIEEILAAGNAETRQLDEIGLRVASHLIEGYRARSEHSRDVVDALCQLAASNDVSDRSAAVKLIFPRLVECLSDSFDPDLAVLYDAVFSQIIDHQRRQREGLPIHEALTRFGLRNEEDMRNRRERLRRAGSRPLTSAPRRVVAFSRVTVGADVAITRVILARLRQIWPDVPVTLVGPKRLRELFGGDDGIEVLEAPYPRHGSLSDRLLTWVGLLELLEHTTGPHASGTLFLDPDSRLTQLGLLPVSPDDEGGYRIFESRTYGADTSECLGRLAARWASEVFPSKQRETAPALRLATRHIDLGRRLVEMIRGGERRVVSVSFGVGGNPDKSSGGAFETDLLVRLIERGHGIVLDRGVGEDRAASESTLERLRGQGMSVLDVRETDPEASRDPEQIDVLAWEGGLGGFSAMIRASDLYVGYDSAFQHIAAALGVPVVTIIERSPGPRFRARWRTWSRQAVRVVPSDDSSESLLDQACRAIRDLQPAR